MADFKTQDFKPYEQALWVKPDQTNQSLWHEPKNKDGSIPEPLYRLRLSILKNKQGHRDCPLKVFVYPTLSALYNATTAIKDTFGGAFPECTIQMGGCIEDSQGARTTDEAVIGAVEDGRTENAVLGFDTQSADETWEEFLERVEKLEERWTVDNGEEGKAF